MKTTVHFEVVQVESRLEDGRLKTWWPGDKIGTLQEAKAKAVRLRKQIPGIDYEVIRITMDQMPEPARAKKAKS